MPTRFTVMTWNVENLFPAGSQYGPETPERYEQKMTNAVTTIKELQPDVLAVQEVGDLATFTDLQQRLEGSYPFLQLSHHPDQRGIRVGFLSHRPFLGDGEEMYDFPEGALRNVLDEEGQVVSQMSRGVLTVTVEPREGFPVHMATLHLKSKVITYPDGRREPRDENERARGTGITLLRRAAEAVAVRVYLNGLMEKKKEAWILLGDCNDGPEAVTTQILLGPEDRSLAVADTGDDVQLYNLAGHIPLEHRYSHIYKKRPELIDHILVSRELISHLQKVESAVEHMDSIGLALEPRRSAPFPNHAPVYATFEV